MFGRKTIKKLRAENEQLKQELQELDAMYSNAIDKIKTNGKIQVVNTSGVMIAKDLLSKARVERRWLLGKWTEFCLISRQELKRIANAKIY